jgi:hypothetical protein
MRVARISRATGLCLTIVGHAITPGASAAESHLSAYQGAWLQGGDCSEVFSSGAKEISFRKPVDIFAAAFIVAGSRLRTPTASCRLKALRRAGDRDVLTLSCANSVSTSDVKVEMATAPDGTLRRYSNGQDTMGAIYQRCSR